jgi:rfaE bifunctional protein nucleotidyltransferase chain/domain
LYTAKRKYISKKREGTVMHPRNKIISSLAELSRICERCRLLGNIIVLTSGCFDLLHGGHLEYIFDSAKLGKLVVGINSDVFVKKLKGESRPIRDQDDRALLIAGFSAVEYVIIFESDLELIDAVRPDVYIASSTSHVKIWDDVERIALLNSIDAKVIEIESKKLDSTTSIIKRASV